MPRSEHYEPKLKITGSFEDVIKVSITPTPEKKEEEKPVQKKK
jgi:hypothetical protein